MAENQIKNSLEKATLGGGCYWCTEAIFQRIHGVSNVISGFAHPQKEYVETKSKKQEQEAEAIHFDYDPSKISFSQLVWIFLQVHDPTTNNVQNKQENKYRSVIVYHNETQKEEGKEAIKKLEEQKIYEYPIATELFKFDKFISAKEEHQNYYNNNRQNDYCKANIDPKIKSFFTKFQQYQSEQIRN